MTRSILLFALICSIIACDSHKQANPLQSDSLETSTKSDSIIDSGEEQAAKVFATPPVLKLSVIGTVDLSRLQLDSMSTYRQGSCNGTLRRYSSRRVNFAADSLSCENGAFINTYYLLTPKGNPEIVYIKESMPFIDPETELYAYSQREQVFDFSTDSLFLMFRTDTISNEDERGERINKIYSMEILDGKEESFEQFKTDYLSKWQ